MNKLLNILGPAMIALAPAVAVSAINNSNNVSNHIYQTEETTTFAYEANIAANANDATQPQTGKFDVSESLVNFITEIKTFVATNYITNFEIVAFQSVFNALQVNEPMTGSDISSINEALQFAVKNVDAKIKLTMEIKEQWMQSYSFTLQGEITNAKEDKTYTFDFSTYNPRTIYNSYQLLQGFTNVITLNYELPKSIDHIDLDYNSGIKIKNLGFNWYAHQVKEVFNYDENEYYDLARNYIHQTLAHTKAVAASLYAIGIQQVKKDFDEVGQSGNKLLPGDSYLDSTLITAKEFYVVFESFKLSGQFKMLVQIYG